MDNDGKPAAARAKERQVRLGDSPRYVAWLAQFRLNRASRATGGKQASRRGPRCRRRRAPCKRRHRLIARWRRITTEALMGGKSREKRAAASAALAGQQYGVKLGEDAARLAATKSSEELKEMSKSQAAYEAEVASEAESNLRASRVVQRRVAREP